MRRLILVLLSCFALPGGVFAAPFEILESGEDFVRITFTLPEYELRELELDGEVFVEVGIATALISTSPNPCSR